MFWSFLFLKQIPLSNGYKYPMLWGYRMRCSWIKRNKLAPNQNLSSEKAKIDRKFKKITYPSGWYHGWSRNAKRDRQMHATFLKQNDFYTPCTRWHVFLFSINVNKNENTNYFRCTAILFQKSYVVSNDKPTLSPAIRRKHWPVWTLCRKHKYITLGYGNW